MQYNTLIVPLALAGCPILALAGLGCLLLYKGRYRRRLVWAAGVFLTALVLFLGGEVLLGFFRLTWRNIPSGVLCGVLLLSGWVGIILTMACILDQKWPGLAPVLRAVVKFAVSLFAMLVFLVTLWLGPMLITFAYSARERVVEYQGQALLEVDEGFLDSWYRYYPYHGPLVRGTERIYEGPPLDLG